MVRLMRKTVAGVLLGCVAAGVILLAALAQSPTGANPFDTIELKTYDWRLARTARPETARKDIALVEIDESSLRNLQANAGRWPWPRAVHSMLIDYLARGPAKVIVYDIDFAEADAGKTFDLFGSTWSGAESDKALADSIRAAGNVILLADASYDGESKDAAQVQAPRYPLDVPGIIERRALFPPFPALAASASALGHNLFILDADGPIRHAVPFVRHRGSVLPSLGVAAALRVAGSFS
jgi:adenylate cyclase